MSLHGRFRWAAFWIIVAAVMDGFDGIVARATKSQSDFGIELDSLADAVSFGVAASLLIYLWGLGRTGAPGLFFSFVFLSAGSPAPGPLQRPDQDRARPEVLPGADRALGGHVHVLPALLPPGPRGDPGNGPSCSPSSTLFVSFCMISTLPYRNFTNALLQPEDRHPDGPVPGHRRLRAHLLSEDLPADLPVHQRPLRARRRRRPRLKKSARRKAPAQGGPVLTGQPPQLFAGRPFIFLAGLVFMEERSSIITRGDRSRRKLPAGERGSPDHPPLHRRDRRSGRPYHLAAGRGARGQAAPSAAAPAVDQPGPGFTEAQGDRSPGEPRSPRSCPSTAFCRRTSTSSRSRSSPFMTSGRSGPAARSAS